MKIPQKIYRLLDNSEKINVEYKENINNTEIKETMVAYANRIGGIIIVGIKELYNKQGYQKGEIKGLLNRNVDKDKELIQNISIDITPTIQYNFNEYYDKEKKMIYVIQVKESDEKPVCTKGGRYKIRGQKGNIAIFPDMMRTIIFNEEEKLKLLQYELKFNKETAEVSKSLFSENINSGYTKSFFRYKLFTILSIMNSPSKFISENYKLFEELYYCLSMLNTLLNNLPVFAIMSSSNYNYGINSYNIIADEAINDINKLNEIIEKRIKYLKCSF